MASAGHGAGRLPPDRDGLRIPVPAGSQIRYPESGWTRLTEGGCPVWNADADWAKR